MTVSLSGDTLVYQKGSGLYKEAEGVAVIGGGGVVAQVSPDLGIPADLLAAYDNFSGVVVGDFVTVMKTSNGQSILALSGSPETIGESTIVLNKPAPQPCALEFEGSIVRNRHQFATVGVFENLNGVAEPTLTPINITSIYQSSADNGVAYNAVAGTIVTIVLETALPAWPSPGGVYLSDWVHVNGLVDSRLNYPNLTIKFISADRKTITAGFSDEVALPSLAVATITPTLGDAKLHFYNNMAGAHDAVTMRFANTTDASAALLTLFGGGDAQVSGTLVGDHRVTIGTTARNLVTSVNGELELKATNRFRIECRPREVSFHDRVIDNSAVSWTTRFARTGVKPGGSASLRPRMRLYRPPSMSRPIGKIVSAVKTGTTTATVTTASAHGLVTGNYVTLKGARDVTNFANLTTPVAVTVTGATTFTAVWGGAVTATTYGGVVVLANGGQDITVAVAQNAQAAVIDSTIGWLTLTGNTTWTGTQAGDYVDLYGVRADTTGADLGLDGTWQVVSIATTALVLKPLANIAGVRITPGVTSLGATNCGGAVILRTTIRAHDFMFEAWLENQVMVDGAGTTRLDKAVPVNVVNTPATTISSGTITTVTTLSTLTGGSVAEDAATAVSPVITGGVVRTAAGPITPVAGDAMRTTMTVSGAQTVEPYAVPEVTWQTPPNVAGILNSAAVVQVQIAGGAGLRNYVTSLDYFAETLGAATSFRVREPDIACSSQTIASNTLVTAAAHDLAIGDAIVFSATTVTGITANTVTYYVLTVPSTTSITIATSRGGSTSAISGSGVTATLHKVLWQMQIPTTGAVPRQLSFRKPLRGSANKALQIQTATASVTGAVYANIQGFVAP